MAVGDSNATLRTSARRLLEEAHEYVGQDVNEDRIKRALIDACQAHSDEHYFFSEASWVMSTKLNQSIYSALADGTELPVNMGFIVGDIWLTPQGTVDNRYRVRGVTMDRLEDVRQWDVYASWPDHWSWYDEKLHVFPVPDTDEHVLEFRYTPKIAVPKYEWDGDSWKYTNDDTYSEWFDPDFGERLTREYAAYLVMGKIADKDRAEVFLRAYLEEKDRLIARTASRATADVVDGYGLPT